MPAIDLSNMRIRSLGVIRHLGYAINESLPLLDSFHVIRSVDETIDRLLAMYCVAASAYGFDRNRALNWFSENSITESLTPVERNFLETGDGPTKDFKFQIEGIWALYWSCSLTSELLFTKQCPQYFVKQLPDIKAGESAQKLRSNAELRQDEMVVELADLAYCIHWAVNDAGIRGGRTSSNIPLYVVRERRRALDWLLLNEAWDEISLDT